jgi:hypothetical protein
VLIDRPELVWLIVSQRTLQSAGVLTHLVAASALV